MARQNSRKAKKPTAKASTARAKRRHARLPDDVAVALKALLCRVEVAAFGASTVMGALLHQDMGRDGEIAVCVETLIANTLDEIVDEGAALVNTWCETPYAPVLQSLLLGMRSHRRIKRARALTGDTDDTH